jgi:dual specificity phosphatase 3
MHFRPIPQRLFAGNSGVRPADPNFHWRRLCWVTDGLAVSGDLHPSPSVAATQLDGWVTDGVTDILDTRFEANDEDFVGHRHPRLRYHWMGVDDEGGPRDAAWFDSIASVSEEILADPHRKLVVHCHMGINRGPSAAFVALVANGGDPIQTLTAIRHARPIASAMYSLDAIQWWAARSNLSDSESESLYQSVLSWHRANPLDVPYCISHIGNRYAA